MINTAHTTNLLRITHNTIREYKHLNNTYMDKCIRISEHLIHYDTMDNNSKLALLSIHRYYMTKYIKSIRTRVGTNNKSRPSICSLRVVASFSYVFRKLRSVVKYISELSKFKIIKDFMRIPNVTNVHWDRCRIPHLFLIKRSKNGIRHLCLFVRIQIKRGKY